MALVNPNIAMSYRGVEVPQQNALADYAAIQQIQGGRQTQEMNALKMQQAQKEIGAQNVLSQAYAQATNPETGEIDYNKLRSTLATGGAGAQIPGVEKLRRESETAALTQREAAFKVQDAKGKFIAQAKRDTSNNPSDANLTAFKEDLLANPLFTEPEKTLLGANIDRILAMPVGERRAFMASQGASPSDLKPSNLQINQGGQTQVLQMPAFGGAGTSVGTYADVPLPKVVEEQKSRIAKAGASNISMSTEKKYGEAFGGKLAEADIGKLSAAEKAPQLAESANRIIGLVSQGNVFTGPVADIKLNIARALNVAGTNNQDKIANTEQLIQSTGQSTLDAIKSAGLGTGQGFTDKDLKFLQGIAGGTINLTAQTLTELASLQHRAASRSAESWNKRVKEMPSEVLKGTGLSTTPITVAPLTAGKAAGPTAGTIQDGYRFKGGSPADPKNWEKM